MPVTTLRQQSKTKAARYCAYQERTQQEVRDKLYSYGLYTDMVEEVLTELIMEGFVSEERYAQAYCRGKFMSNKWGENQDHDRATAKRYFRLLHPRWYARD